MVKSRFPILKCYLDKGLRVFEVICPNFLVSFSGSILNFQASSNLRLQYKGTCRRKGKTSYQTCEALPSMCSLAGGEKPWIKDEVGILGEIGPFLPGAGTMGPSSSPAAPLLESLLMLSVHMLLSDPAT